MRLHGLSRPYTAIHCHRICSKNMFCYFCNIFCYFSNVFCYATLVTIFAHDFPPPTTTKLLLGPLSAARGQKFAVNEWSAVKNSVSTYGLFWLNLYTLIRKSASYSHTNTFCFSYRIERISYKKKGSRIETTWIEDILYNLYGRRNNVPYCNTYFHFWEMQKIIARNFNWKCDK